LAGFQIKNEQVKIMGNARKITDNELDLWIAAPLEQTEKKYSDWIEKEKEWVSDNKIPMLNLFIYENEGTYPGKLCILNEPGWLLISPPVIKNCRSTIKIVESLYRFAIDDVKKRNIPCLYAYIDQHNEHHTKIIEGIIKAGFIRCEIKQLYYRALEDLPVKIDILKFGYGYELGENVIKRLFIRSREGSLDYAGNPHPPDIDDDFETIRPVSIEDYVIAYLDDEVVGFSSPGFCMKETGTLGFITILPEYRGRGFGDLLFIESLKRLISMGAKKYLGSANIKNYPMINIFERNGCKKKVLRSIFVYIFR
jgi:GNAT superfamily N-acetyltransferase